MTLCKLQKELSRDWKSNLLAWLHTKPASWPRLSWHVTCYQCVIKPPQPDIRLTRNAPKGRADCALSLSAIVHSSGGISSISAACRQYTLKHTHTVIYAIISIYFQIQWCTVNWINMDYQVFCVSSWRPSGRCLLCPSTVHHKVSVVL